MAQDGSQPWRDDGAFSYLLHHPLANPGNPTATVKPAQSFAKIEGSGNTGTWHGPAPQGYLGRSGLQPEKDTQVGQKRPRSAMLPGGGKLPLIGFGTDKISSEDTFKLALHAGYRHLDCAAKYGNEGLVGKALKEFLASSDGAVSRDDVFITSKVWNDNHRPDLVRSSVEQSLQDLGCEYLDLLLMHWPDAWKPGTEKPDEEVTIKQTWQAMEELVKEGKVKHLGVANFGLSKLEELLQTAVVKPVVNQGVLCVAYSPLGHGTTELLQNELVVRIANEIGRSPAQVLLQWSIQRGVPVIPRSSTEKNIHSNIAEAFTWELSIAHKDSWIEALHPCMTSQAMLQA